MSNLPNRRIVVAAGLSLAIVGEALRPGAARAAEPVRVGSKIDTEGALLGNMIIASLEARGIATENKLQLGPTKIVRSALLSGEIDLYPEYTGNGAFFFSIDTDPVWKNAAAGYAKVAALDLAQNKLVWLQAAPANNTWAIAVRKDVADTNKLSTLVDFAKWVNAGGSVKMAASAEFVESPAALPAFEAVYGFKLTQDQLVTLAGGDTAVTIRAAAEQTSGVNTAMAYGTDGALAALGLVVLDDSKGAQIVYEPTPVVRQDVLAAYPDIKTILDPVFASLDATVLRSLNASIEVDGKQAKLAASDYLKSKAFLK